MSSVDHGLDVRKSMARDLANYGKRNTCEGLLIPKDYNHLNE